MKNTLLALVVFTALFTHAQTTDEECAFDDSLALTAENIFTFSTDPEYLASFEPKVFNIYYWQINDPNGDYGNRPELTETSVLESVASLNIVYNPFNIYFKYTGFGCFDSPSEVYIQEPDPTSSIYSCYTVLDGNGNPFIDPEGYGNVHKCQISDTFNWAENNGYKIPDAFNIYIPYATSGGFGGVVNQLGLTEAMAPRNRLNSTTFHHEIAHCLGIAHTRSKKPDATSYNENVTRDKFLPDGITLNPDYNAETTADKVVDTHAYFSFYSGDPNDPYAFIDEFCEYFGTDRDQTDRLYTDLLTVEDVKNTMSDAYDCWPEEAWDSLFTIGQAIRMQEAIVWDPYGAYLAASTTVSALYEPYKGVYYEQGPANDPHTAPLFQPGFDYQFISCDCQGVDNLDCSLPCDYQNTSFHNNHTVISSIDKYTSDYSSITHPNHTAIQIPILDNQPRKCYDNWNRDAIGGSVTRFNDNVFNTNVTITPQDSTAINSQTLIDNLDNGLYKIEKAYDDGSSQEKVIYKENN